MNNKIIEVFIAKYIIIFDFKLKIVIYITKTLIFLFNIILANFFLLINFIN